MKILLQFGLLNLEHMTIMCMIARCCRICQGSGRFHCVNQSYNLNLENSLKCLGLYITIDGLKTVAKQNVNRG